MFRYIIYKYKNNSKFCIEKVSIIAFILMINCTGAVKNTQLVSKRDSIYTSDYQIKSIKFSNYPDPIFLSYNSNGDLILIKNGAFKFKFDYQDSLIIRKCKLNEDDWNIQSIYLLNKNGQIIQKKIFTGTKLEFVCQYIYDEFGYLMQTIDIDCDASDSIFTSYKYLNGNLIEENITSHFGKGTQKKIFEYSPLILNTYNVFHAWHYPEPGDLIERNRLGIGNLHLPSRSIYFDEEGDTFSIVKNIYPKCQTESEFIQIRSDLFDSTPTKITYQLRKIK